MFSAPLGDFGGLAENIFFQIRRREATPLYLFLADMRVVIVAGAVRLRVCDE
jgi:hypothetical protein